MALLIMLIIIAVVGVPIMRFANKNLYRDEKLMSKVWNCGFHEKQATTPKGTVLSYGVGGAGRAIPLLLIHGQGQAWQDYMEVLPELGKKFHVYSISCHGHGKSSHDPSRYTCEKMTEDFAWFIENVIGRPCVVSGHSSGGILATALAAYHKDLVRGLIIEDAPFFCVEPEEMKERRAVAWLDNFCIVNDYMKEFGTADASATQKASDAGATQKAADAGATQKTSDASEHAESYNVYYLKHSLLFGLFGGLRNKIIPRVERAERKHPGKPVKIWFIPQNLLRAMYYSADFDKKFAMAFYDGTWLEGMSQEKMLAEVDCPCTYMKAKTGYLIDGKPQTDLTGKDTSEAVLCCANTEADAEKVMSLLQDCRRVDTETSDHLIHGKYPELFIEEVSRYAK